MVIITNINTDAFLNTNLSNYYSILFTFHIFKSLFYKASIKILK